MSSSPGAENLLSFLRIVETVSSVMKRSVFSASSCSSLLLPMLLTTDSSTSLFLSELKLGSIGERADVRVVLYHMLLQLCCCRGKSQVSGCQGDSGWPCCEEEEHGAVLLTSFPILSRTCSMHRSLSLF